MAKRFSIDILELGNAGNHLHLILKFKKRSNLTAFLKTAPGLIARRITHARKGHPVGRFWTFLAYTKILGWGRQLHNAIKYVKINALEGWGVLGPRDLTNSRLRHLTLEDFEESLGPAPP
jgi:REP element-mobilizing transposase RayT